MPTYTAHGLNIKSEITFPELLESSEDSDILIKYGDFDYSSKKIISEGVFRIASHYILTEESMYLIWNNIDICQIIKGEEIIVNSQTSIDETFLRALILGPALGILLHQRGRLVLHASAVNMNDVAVAFMGHNGAGKSTTTFSFMNSGYPLIADDILSIEFRDNLPVVFPGLPRIKLWPESMEIFDKSMESFPIHPESRKRSFLVDDFCNQVVSLKHIYVIENKEKTYLEELKPQEALIELIRNSYCANIFQNSDQATNLEEYAKIVKNVSIKQLNIERSLDKIPEMVNLVEKDVY
ncbi:MAG: hypothetical protein Q7V10_06090 [Methanobacteriaceae archaeon]|nr:hypothetical protein [Methanobacteriaceae archaeon]MDO9626620.1 hypothetical protein [Methanobacteriaceae archaeon]